MKETPRFPGNAGEEVSVPDAYRAGRRRLLRAGLSAAPVVMTVISGPVLAQAQCQSPSGFTSANTSGHQGATCSGRTPGYWRQSQHFNAWVAYYPVLEGGHNATLFCDVFPDCSVYSGKTLLQVLETGGGPPDDVGRHIVAALLNWSSGYNPPSLLDLPTILDIWHQYITLGFYYPNYPSLIPAWDHGAIASYLQSTMPL